VGEREDGDGVEDGAEDVLESGTLTKFMAVMGGDGLMRCGE
jgi:hypothetical protein